MEKTYFELKITFMHIVILLIAIIIIGVLLFYMGYKSGYRTNPNLDTKQTLTERKIENKTRDADQQVEEKPLFNATSQTSSIQKKARSEENLFTSEKDKIHNQLPKTTSNQSFFSVRVGAFSNHVNAENYASKFKSIGYEIKITPGESASTTKLFYVLVGKFQNIEKAKIEKDKLEKMENKIFLIVPYR